MDNLRRQAAKFGARFEQTLVSGVHFSSQPRKLICSDRTVQARSLIISTGASPRMTGVPGERELLRRKGRDDLRHLRRILLSPDGRGRIGGGDSAAEEALFLTRFASRRSTWSTAGTAAGLAHHGRTGHLPHPKITPTWDSIPLGSRLKRGRGQRPQDPERQDRGPIARFR